MKFTDNNYRYRILVVEDNLGTLKIIEKILATEYEIDAENNGEDAVKKAASSKYDLILMDISLGLGINGIQAAARIKNNGDNTNTPIIAMTAYEADYYNEINDKNLFNGYLEKPFELKALTDLVQNIFISE